MRHRAHPGPVVGMLALLAAIAGGCSRPTEDWVADVSHSDEFYRLMAVVALRECDPNDVPIAVEALLQGARDRKGEVSRAAIESLVAISDRSLPLLLDRLSDPDVDVARKRDLVPVLTAIAGRRSAPPPVEAMLRSVERIPAEQVHFLSQAIAAAGANALPSLLHALDSPSATRRSFAASTLTQMGSTAAEAQPKLLALVASETDPVTRMWTVRALARIGPMDEPTRRQMTELLLDTESPVVRKIALLALVPHHLARLDDPAETVRQHATRALERFGVSAMPAYLEILRTGDESLHAKASARLGMIGAGALEPLLAELADETHPRRKALVDALSRMGVEAVPALIETVCRGHRNQRAYAATALGRIGIEARAAIPALRDALRDPARGVRIAAIFALGEMLPDSLEARDDVLEAGAPKAIRQHPSAAGALRRFQEADAPSGRPADGG